VNSLPKTVTRQRRDCDLNPGPSAPESSTRTTRLPSHPPNVIAAVKCQCSRIVYKVAAASCRLSYVRSLDLNVDALDMTPARSVVAAPLPLQQLLSRRASESSQLNSNSRWSFVIVFLSICRGGPFACSPARRCRLRVYFRILFGITHTCCEAQLPVACVSMSYHVFLLTL